MTTHSKPTTKTPATKTAKVAKPAKAVETVKVVKAAATKRVAAKPTRSKAAAPVTVPRKRPLIALARKADGRGLSLSERLAELRHKQFKHSGPVCHSCRMSASELARAAAPAA